MAKASWWAGTWHLNALGETSWHGFAQGIFEQACVLGLLAKVPEFIAITTVEYPTSTRRPAYSGLDTSTLCDDFKVSLPDWRAGLAQVLGAVAC